MIDWILIALAKVILWFRYRIRLKGLEQIEAKGKTGIVFLPNHPALIDPIIMNTYLHSKFTPRSFADQDQVDRPVIGFIAKRWGVRRIPSIASYGPAVRKKVEEVLDQSVEGLRNGENLLLWPSGMLYKTKMESLGANSSVERIIEKFPDVRIVLVRTRGLWGSGFSWASGTEPLVLKVLGKGLLYILASFLFFTPRRNITIELYEPDDLPRGADRNKFNRYLENWYNEDAPANTHVPFTLWEKGGIRTVPEPQGVRLQTDYSIVPDATRDIVLKQITEMTGVTQLTDESLLAADLGMDSLARTDIQLWLEQQFGIRQADADAMQTVGDVMLAACGEFVYVSAASVKPVPGKWFKPRKHTFARLGDGETITEAFLAKAAATPSTVVIADQNSGVKTYRDIVIACMVLKPHIEKLQGQYIGIMLPASIAADIFYLATMFAGKTPVMVNWTAGARNIHASLDSVGVKHIITAKLLVERIAMQGIDLSEIANSFVFAEDIGKNISKLTKIKALLCSYISWHSLRKTKPTETAAIIFTSGSETLPKAVPLTHTNILTNMRAVLDGVDIYHDDKLIGFLPPFHSFGLTVTMVLPLCGAIPIMYHPNPTEADTLAKLINAYKVTLLIGTPTFLGGIVRIGTKEQLTSLRLSVTGAEKCPQKVYDALAAKCENAIILEGYGVTECSPIISFIDEKNPMPGTIGKVIPILKHILIDPDTSLPVQTPGKGILLVRGPTIFAGYLNYDGKSPFVEVAGKSWYSTGDLIEEDAQGVMTFAGRIKRFVKLGGEMVSLPAIEAVLQSKFATDDDSGPVIAVEAPPTENPELVLFTTLDIDRESANNHIRQAGLSGLHNIRRVIKLDDIPILGTGKTNYRALKELITEE